jgi:hypothetical protein
LLPERLGATRGWSRLGDLPDGFFATLRAWVDWNATRRHLLLDARAAARTWSILL